MWWWREEKLKLREAQEEINGILSSMRHASRVAVVFVAQKSSKKGGDKKR
jgi:hypothetical protein